MQFPGSLIFNDLQSSNITVHPRTAHRPLKNGIFQRPANTHIETWSVPDHEKLPRVRPRDAEAKPTETYRRRSHKRIADNRPPSLTLDGHPPPYLDMTILTPRQAQILDFIRRWQRNHGSAPTRAEIASHFSFRSLNGAEQHLRALDKKGVIELRRGESRGIRLLDADTAGHESGLPVVGRVAAGNPILAQQHIEERIELPTTLFHSRADYLLRIQGMSMRDAGILDGDLLAVRRGPEADNGQIVVARIGDEVTVKRFHRQANWKHKVLLLPENPDFDPIPVDLRHQRLVIEGLAVGLVRAGI